MIYKNNCEDCLDKSYSSSWSNKSSLPFRKTICHFVNKGEEFCSRMFCGDKCSPKYLQRNSTTWHGRASCIAATSCTSHIIGVIELFPIFVTNHEASLNTLSISSTKANSPKFGLRKIKTSLAYREILCPSSLHNSG